MKIGHLKEYNKNDFFEKNHAESEVGRLVPDLFLFYKRVLYQVKTIDLQLSYNIFR